MTREEYLRSVSYWLNDLPWRIRQDLLAEIRAHLDELPAGTDLNARLETPEEYAADLRSAAGLERRRGVIAFLRARRPRNLILTVVLLTVVGLAIGAVVWIDSYQPITFAGGTQLPPDSRPSLGQVGESVVFRRGRPFEYGITIQNAGRFTVRVLGVRRSPTDFYAGRLLMSKDQTGHMDEWPLERFHPFAMKPGSFRWLVFGGRLRMHHGDGTRGRRRNHLGLHPCPVQLPLENGNRIDPARRAADLHLPQRLPAAGGEPSYAVAGR